MNLNGINQIQTSFVQVSKAKEEEAKAQEEKLTTEPKKAGDSGCLKNYFAGASNVSFGHPCSTSQFKVKKLKDVPCCCCGKPMLRVSDQKVCEQALSRTAGPELAANIEAYSKYMRADEKALSTIIAQDAKKSGGDLSTSLKHVSSNLKKLTGEYSNGILNELNTMATGSFKSEENPVSALIQKAQKDIKAGRGLDRCEFVENLDKATAALSEEDQGLIQDLAMNLPQSFEHVKRIQDKYLNRTNGEIARRIFSTALTTAEHIHPHSLGGPDDTKNYIAECAGCNNPRGNMDYADWLKVHPEYPRKAQEHIEHVQARLINGELTPDYNSYPVEVRGSLSKESGGRMVLKVLNPSTIEKMRQQRGITGKVTVEDVKAAYEKQEQEKAEKSEKA